MPAGRAQKPARRARGRGAVCAVAGSGHKCTTETLNPKYSCRPYASAPLPGAPQPPRPPHRPQVSSNDEALDEA